VILLHAGTQYAAKVLSLAKSDPQAFICHFYNFYFAHTAGGRMIGSKVRLQADTYVDNQSWAQGSILLPTRFRAGTKQSTGLRAATGHHKPEPA
jgi:hypothetical protein